MGTHKSTFSYRIQEEREILGFEEDLTFNMFCPDGQFNCMKPNIWRIKYPKEHIDTKKARRQKKKNQKSANKKRKDEL